MRVEDVLQHVAGRAAPAEADAGRTFDQVGVRSHPLRRSCLGGEGHNETSTRLDFASIRRLPNWSTTAWPQGKRSRSNTGRCRVYGTGRPGLPAVRPEAPSEVEALKARLASAEQREEAVRQVLRALIISLRPFGFNRQRFLRCVREEGRDTPSEGPAAIRHTVLEQEARRVLREAR